MESLKIKQIHVRTGDENSPDTVEITLIIPDIYGLGDETGIFDLASVTKMNYQTRVFLCSDEGGEARIEATSAGLAIEEYVKRIEWDEDNKMPDDITVWVVELVNGVPVGAEERHTVALT
jgi:hypothetical protein